jgi:CRP-like cAMP-binding protein
MSDHDPVLLRRLLELRQFPMFAGAELGELAMLAENVREIWYPSGAVIARPPAADAIHLILSGQIDAGAQAHPAHRPFGVLEVLARRPLGAPAVAVGETRTLRLTAAELREVLEDNFGLMLITLRELAGRTLAAGPVRSAGAAGAASAAALAGPASLASPLGLVERMIVLRRQLPFTSAAPFGPQRAPLEAIAILAHASQETTWPAGAVMARSGEPSRHLRFLLDGAVRVTRDEGEPYLLGPGSSLGVLESLAGAPHAGTVEVVAPVRALEIASSVIFDVLEDHTELGFALIESLAGGLLDTAAALEATTS